MEQNNYFSVICLNSLIGGDFMGIMGNAVLPGILLLNKISLFKKKKSIMWLMSSTKQIQLINNLIPHNRCVFKCLYVIIQNQSFTSGTSLLHTIASKTWLCFEHHILVFPVNVKHLAKYIQNTVAIWFCWPNRATPLRILVTLIWLIHPIS